MKLTKNNAIKFIKIINESNLKVFTCENLSLETGFSVDYLMELIEEFYSMIRLDANYNLRELIPDLESYVRYLEETNSEILESDDFDKEADNYRSFIDYVYKNMTVAGGILDTGYELSDKDRRILKKLIDKKPKK